MTTIIIKSDRGEHALVWGSNHSYKRVPGSVTIKIGGVGDTGYAQGCGGIGVEFDVCPDGSIQMRRVSCADGNYYMHIVVADGAPTAAQIATLQGRPFGAPAGRSVIAWASGEAAAKIASRHHD